MSLFKREKLTPSAKKATDSFKMTNTSPEFQEERAVQYIQDNDEHFAKDASDFVGHYQIAPTP